MNLQEFFAENPRVAIAFSGGVDSSYLLYAALHYGARARAYYVNSAFQPAFELEDARRLAGELNADMKVLPVDVLASETVTAKPRRRRTASPCCWTAPTPPTTPGTDPVCGPCGSWRCGRLCGSAA